MEAEALTEMDKRILAAAIGIVCAATLAVVAPATFAAAEMPGVANESRSKVSGSSY